ncbi:TPA: hypothetical protein ACQYC4_001348 [Vibrio parahaemolyticus]
MYNARTELKYKPLMKQEVIDCLKLDMKVCWKHFSQKLSSFTADEKVIICNNLSQLYNVSTDVKAKKATDADYNALYYESGSPELNEFLQAMFDCFKDWQVYSDIELIKCLYAHTNRGTDNWFPVVIINKKINEFQCEGELVTVYRGCHNNELTTDKYTQRQSWSTDFNVAKSFAFYHPSSDTPRNDRIVIKATVNKESILWARNAESEVVLALDFTAKSVSTAMTYDEFIAQGGDA